MAKSRRDAGTAPLWGVSAEFATAESMVAAIHALRDRGLGRIDAFSPVPVPAMHDALRLPRQTIHPWALLAAGVGGLLMFGTCT